MPRAQTYSAGNLVYMRSTWRLQLGSPMRVWRSYDVCFSFLSGLYYLKLVTIISLVFCWSAFRRFLWKWKKCRFSNIHPQVGYSYICRSQCCNEHSHAFTTITHIQRSSIADQIGPVHKGRRRVPGTFRDFNKNWWNNPILLLSALIWTRKDIIREQFEGDLVEFAIYYK